MLNRIALSLLAVITLTTACAPVAPTPAAPDDAQITPLELHDGLQVKCHENDALVLRSSLFVSNGAVLYLTKKDGEWQIAQTINLGPYLDGWHAVPVSYSHREFCDLNVRTFDYNDRWLCILIRKTHAGESSSSHDERQSRVLIFEKDADQWRYRSTLGKDDVYLTDSRIALSGNDLFVCDVIRKTDASVGVVYCYELSENEPVFKQEILPPESNVAILDGREAIQDKYPSPGMIGPELYVSNDRLIVDWCDQVTDEARKKSDAFRATKGIVRDPRIIKARRSNPALYQLIDGKWQYVDSFLTKVPENTMLFCENDPIGSATRVDFEKDRFVFYNTDLNYVSVFPFKDGKIGKMQSKSAPSRINAPKKTGFRTTSGYYVYLLNEHERLGIVKPSPDDVVHFAEPDWIIEDADPETCQMTLDFYKKAGASTSGYVPESDYALCGSTLVTSYVFDECYIGDADPSRSVKNPLPSAKVWEGVNIYEIDPEKGPKRVFAMTSRNMEPLKPEPRESLETRLVPKGAK